MDNYIINNEKDDEFLEVEDYEIENFELDRHSLIFYTVDKSVENLKRWVDSNKLIIPEFQRDFIWRYNNSVRFIESILLNLPIPSILVYKKIDQGREVYILVDGLQRIQTICQFVNGTYSSENGEREFKINLKNSNWYNKTYQTLDLLDKEFFNDYSISVTIFEHPTNNELNRLNAMYDIFERINTGSEGLTSQEIRNAIYQGDGLSKFIKESEESYFKSISDIQSKYSKRKRNVELLIRINAYYYIYHRIIKHKDSLIDNDNENLVNDYKITTNKNNMLNLYLNAINERLIDQTVFVRIKEIILDILELYTTNVFKSYSRNQDKLSPNISETFIEALIIAWDLVEKHKIQEEDKFAAQKLALWRSVDFYDYFQSKSTLQDNIVHRVQILKEILLGEYKPNELF